MNVSTATQPAEWLSCSSGQTQLGSFFRLKCGNKSVCVCVCDYFPTSENDDCHLNINCSVKKQLVHRTAKSLLSVQMLFFLLVRGKKLKYFSLCHCGPAWLISTLFDHLGECVHSRLLKLWMGEYREIVSLIFSEWTELQLRGLSALLLHFVVYVCAGVGTCVRKCALIFVCVELWTDLLSAR